MTRHATYEIGVDLDNTIVSYDALFFRLARERDLVPLDLPPTKAAVRDYLRRAAAEETWTELQGEAYGPRMVEAQPFAGAVEFLRAARRAGRAVAVISHRTRTPYRGQPHDLHRAARDWLAQQGIDEAHVFLELSQEAKCERIHSLRCRHFIDDLPEVLAHARFPADVTRILFDPEGIHAPAPERVHARTWVEIAAVLAVRVTPPT